MELAAVHGRREDPCHPGGVPAQVRKLLVGRKSPQVELGHGVRGHQTLSAQEVVLDETGTAFILKDGDDVD